MKKKVKIILAITGTALCAFACTAVFIVKPYLHQKECVSEIMLPFMERRFESKFNVEKIRYSFLLGCYKAYMQDTSSGKKYEVHFFDENESETNIVYYDYDERQTHSTRFNNSYYLDLDDAEDSFQANKSKYENFVELCENEKSLMRVEWDYPEYAIDHFADWGDRINYDYIASQKNKSARDIRFCFDTDTRSGEKTSEIADIWAYNERHPIMAYTGKSSEGAVGFLMYVQPAGYSLHIVYSPERNVSDIFNQMHTENELGDGWYITTINKKLIE